LVRAGVEDGVDLRNCLHLNSDAAFEDAESSPGAFVCSVPSSKARRDRVLVPGTRNTKKDDLVGHLRPVAKRAFEMRLDPCRALDLVRDPWAVLKGRAVADVLVVQAREVGDPVPFSVLVETRDLPSHES
jgi:hypothetical protein